MADVFLSYSRKDADFVNRLTTALKATGKSVWQDKSDIPPIAHWREEIASGIDGCNAFVFVITPDSAASPECGKEWSHAGAQKKKLVPLLRRDVDPQTLPGEIVDLNWIFFRDTDDFDGAMRTLLQALDSDLEWVRAHTRLTVKAGEWEKSNRDDSLLLRGADLDRAETWARSAGAVVGHQLTPLQNEYIDAGRRAATRRHRVQLTAVSVALVVATGLAVIAFVQRAEKERQRTIAEERRVSALKQAHARRLAAEAVTLVDSTTERVDISMLVAIESLRLYSTTEADRALRQGMAVSPARIGTAIPLSGGELVALSRTGNHFVIAGTNMSVTVLDSATSRKIVSLNQTSQVHTVVISEDDKYLGVGTDNETILWQDWQTATPREVARLAIPGNALAFNSWGGCLAVGGFGPRNNIALFQLANPGQPFRVLSHPGRRANNAIDRIVFDTSSQFLISLTGNDYYKGQEGSLRIWKWQSGELLRELDHSKLPSSVGRDDLLFLEGRVVETWTRWNSTNALVHGEDFKLPQTIVTISPEERFLVTRRGISTDLTTEETPKVLQIWRQWKTEKPEEIGRIYNASQITFSDNSECFAAWNTTNLQVYKTLGHQETTRVESVDGSLFGAPFSRFSRDGKYLGTIGPDWLHIFELPSGREITNRLNVRTFAFSPDAAQLALALKTNVCLLDSWQRSNSTVVASILASNVQALAFSPDNHWLALMTNYWVTVWSLPKLDAHRVVGRVSTEIVPVPDEEPGVGQLTLIPSGGAGGMITFDPQCRYLSAAAGDHVHMWVGWQDGQPRQVTHQSIHASASAFSADGSHFATADEHDAQSESMAHVFTLIGRTNEADIPFYDMLRDVALGPDGSTLAIAGRRGVELWDVARRDKIIGDEIGDSSGIVFSPDGKYLAAWTGDRTLHVLCVRPEDLIREAGTRLTANLTKSEWAKYVGDQLEFHKTFPDLP